MVFLRALAVIVLTVDLAACGTDDDEASTTTSGPITTSGPGTTATTVTTSVVTSTSSTTTGGRQVTLSQSCTHVEREVRVQVRYPEGWDVNDRDGIRACTAFDPDPVVIPPATEFPRELAVLLLVEPVPFERASGAVAMRVEGERRLTIDGRNAVRQEVVTTGEGLGPAGQRSIRYVIDAGTERSVIVGTWDVLGNDFRRSVEVLDAMAEIFDIEPRRG